MTLPIHQNHSNYHGLASFNVRIRQGRQEGSASGNTITSTAPKATADTWYGQQTGKLHPGRMQNKHRNQKNSREITGTFSEQDAGSTIRRIQQGGMDTFKTSPDGATASLG